MSDQASICAVCAWRETCQKKFKVSGKDIRCADFTRDIKASSAAETAAGAKGGKGK